MRRWMPKEPFWAWLRKIRRLRDGTSYMRIAQVTGQLPYVHLLCDVNHDSLHFDACVDLRFIRPAMRQKLYEGCPSDRQACCTVLRFTCMQPSAAALILRPPLF